MSVSTCAPICFHPSPCLSQPCRPFCGLDRFSYHSILLHLYCLSLSWSLPTFPCPLFLCSCSIAALPSPDFHRHVALSSPFLCRSIPCSSIPTPSCSPLRRIDVPSPIPHLRGPPIISFEQVLINDIHRLMNNSPKSERARNERQRRGGWREGRGDEQRDSCWGEE